MGNVNNKKYFRKIGIGLIGTCSLLVVLSSNVKAQVVAPVYPYSIEVRAGAAIPTGDYADLNETGFDIALKLGYFFTNQLSFRADLETSFLTGKPFSQNGISGNWPNTQLWHYTAGLGYMLTDHALTSFRFGFNAGLGATTVIYDAGDAVKDTYFAVNYGTKIGYGFTESVDIFASVMGYTTFGDEDDGTEIDTFTTWPITLGLNFRF